VYLYQQKWKEAATQSGSLLQTGAIVGLDSLNKVFIKNSNETLLQFWRQNGFSAAGLVYIPNAGEEPNYPLTNWLLNSFEPGDRRKTAWLDSTNAGPSIEYFPFKYKKNKTSTGSDAEYAMVLRLGEQYLIRAEALINTNDLPGAIADLNQLRARAGLAPLTNMYTQNQLLALLQRERWSELFGEWGYRFVDLKRWGQLDAVLGQHKSSWKPGAALLPIPQQEINKNPFLIQNPGY
jgi:hypothetical protein